MNFNMNMHRVTEIQFGPVRTHTAPGGRMNAVRTMLVKTNEGDFEISLFSEYVSEDHEEPLLEVKV